MRSNNAERLAEVEDELRTTSRCVETRYAAKRILALLDEQDNLLVASRSHVTSAYSR